MIDVIPFLAPERHELLALLRGLSDADWAAKTECPAWDVKGLALHIVGDDLSLLSRQRDTATNGVLLYAEEHPGLAFRDLLNGFNEQWVRGAEFFSASLVLEFLELTGTWSAEFYSSVDLTAQSNEPVGFFGAGEPSPWWQVTAREYVERWIHQHQLRRALLRDRLAEELSSPAKDAVVRGFGARIPVLGRFDVGPRSWEFRDGPTVSLEPSKSHDVLSRGLTLDETVASLEGDPDLVRTIAQQTSRR